MRNLIGLALVVLSGCSEPYPELKTIGSINPLCLAWCRSDTGVYDVREGATSPSTISVTSTETSNGGFN